MPRSTPLSAESTILIQHEEQTLLMTRDLVRIGSSPLCDLQLDSGPPLHSLIRREGSVVWIEADADTASLQVNERSCRRLALRDGDVIAANGHQFTFRMQAALVEPEVDELVDSLGQLTAEELCDRILVEESAVSEFEAGRKRGWLNLIRAVEDVADQEVSPVADQELPEDDCELLLNQIRELTELMDVRTRELDQCEAELSAASAILQETQDRVSGQIETLLNQIAAEAPGELRASA